MANRLFTSESVGVGHPDKVCDQISDALLDAFLTEDDKSRCAIETAATTGLVLVMGEYRSKGGAKVLAEAQDIVRETLRGIGYHDPAFGIDCNSCSVLIALHGQSPEIAAAVDTNSSEQGAGDQGMMFGYACQETPELMPLPISLSHQLTNRMRELRESGELSWLRPDCKSQVTVEYDDDYNPIRIHTVVVSTQHDPMELGLLQKLVRSEIINPVIEKSGIDASDMICHINPSGSFTIGGPHGDSGLTGRKIIVDTYGGMGRHGGGAFSGKDASKVDRSAAYACRWVAKNIVAAGLARRCEVQVAYAIGVAQPVSLRVETFGTSSMPESQIEQIVRDTVDLRPAAIIDQLSLRKPGFLKTARNGHFGHSGFAWEELSLVKAFQKASAGVTAGA